MFQGFLEIRKHFNSFVDIIKIMMEDSNLPCFNNFDIDSFKKRFRLEDTESQVFLMRNSNFLYFFLNYLKYYFL